MTNTLIPADAARFEEADKVMRLYITNLNETQIAKKLGIPRKNVVEHVSAWKSTIANSSFMKDRVTELLSIMDESFSRLIAEAWKTLDQVNSLEETGDVDSQYLAQRATAIKVIADIDGKRIDMLQKAGLLDAADMGDEILEMETKQNQIMDILKEVSGTCPTCRMKVAARIGEITGSPVAVVEND